MKEHHHFLGRLVKDADQREFGDSVVFNFTIAVDNSYSDKNGSRIEQTKFIECSFWRNKKSPAGIRYTSERLVKGNLVQISSSNMTARAYQERENGQLKFDSNGDPVLRTVLVVRVAEIEFLIIDKSRITTQQDGQQQAPSSAPAPAPVVEAQTATSDNTQDDLPF